MAAPSSSGEAWLIADIGATTSRCAIHDRAARRTGTIRRYRNADYGGPADLLGEFLAGTRERPQSMALAVAAPVHGDDISMMNRDWAFSTQTLADSLAIADVRVVNDFHAIAFALPVFADGDRTEIGRASQYRPGNLAAIGPGSGLGASAWIGDAVTGAAMTGEGGHVTLAARNDEEHRVIAEVVARFGHASAERILSGPGISLLHEILHGEPPPSSEAITENLQDSACRATMNLFFRFLGSAAADLALITGCFGGLYIAGGIVPACIDPIGAEEFRQRFDDKNRYRDYMQRIPTYVITDPYPGLTGVAAMLARE